MGKSNFVDVQTGDFRILSISEGADLAQLESRIVALRPTGSCSVKLRKHQPV